MGDVNGQRVKFFGMFHHVQIITFVVFLIPQKWRSIKNRTFDHGLSVASECRHKLSRSDFLIPSRSLLTKNDLKGGDTVLLLIMKISIFYDYSGLFWRWICVIFLDVFSICLVKAFWTVCAQLNQNPFPAELLGLIYFIIISVAIDAVKSCN